MSKFARLFAGLALGVMTLFAGVAEAHALLLSSKIEGQDVVLHFNGRVDAARSRLTLVNPDGSNVKQIDCTAGDDPATVKGQLGPLAAGSYVLRWEVLSVDGHISRADLPFTFPAP